MSHNERDEMLDLTVVSLPRPADALAPEVARSRLKLLAIVLVCSLPVILTYLTFYVIRPQGQATLGELIAPAQAAPAGAVATRLDGTTLPLANLKDQWLLVKVDGGACVADCQKQLLLLRQFRLMLGKDMTRVDWVWLVNDSTPVDATLAAHLQKDQAVVARVEARLLQTWLPLPDGKKLQDYIFVIDPMGNAMMRLPAVFDSAGARQAKRDMEHLLRASVAWDAPGRN
jgi:hypothetical protein